MKAFIFDLNGTMINDMEFHLDGWHSMLNKLGARMSREEVRGHMYGKNEELLVRIFGKDRFSLPEMLDIAHQKEMAYQEAFRPHLELIAGLPDFLRAAAAKGISMGIGSAANNFNISYVLDNLHLRPFFKAIVSAEDVTTSKPDPEVFLKCAAALNVAPADCIVFEDAPKGVEAALNAGMEAIALTTMHTREEFAPYTNIRAFVADYHDPVLQQLLTV
ncbi:haloacid dehalogenase superfamily, subfamily IA, variant 3 with third motif having DD or ED/beta-phosphoglucomutase family hydrolase [Chitinophaga eiseniae]|uniref:Beta-phosphoglucomutase n=1 Tax=Chitinophaga eiseniae TaxID=634771 RepID=A0A1T4SVR7_9BACT|nr:HAD family phosphatase [Chitinophaga eiseniae]SKA32259.1 haloacid dehalogenase superfamily, subfamily IA, variant 3 with third motif having DD or ED/beta-phosphoglucomutase family hydrolase [Chitinophaga eiseniae]